MVEASDLDRSSGSQEGVVGGEKDISLSLLGLSSDDNGVSTVGGESINMSTEFNFDDIFVLELGGIISAWGVISADLID